MAFQPVPNTAQFTIITRAAGPVEVNNSIYVRNEVVSWVTATLEAMATAIGDAWRDGIVPEMASTATMDRVEARSLDTEFGAFATVEYNTVGGDAGAPLSAMDCVYVSLVGSGGSAPRRGALFLSPFVEADLTVDAWTNGTKIAALQAGLDDIDAAISGGSNAWVIVSRYSKATVPTPPHRRATAITNPVSDILVQSNLATQRDRRVGQGV